MKLANQIRNARRAAKLSQSEAAAKWGISLRTLQQWEQGRSQPQGLAMQKLRELIASTKSSKSSGRKG
jgi:DNA-binding transcriptional regulator YiaG